MPPPRKNPKHQIPPPEVVYADLISAGIVKVVRQKGKAPLVVWLTERETS